MNKQQIFLKGNAGLTHMLASTHYALNLSEDLNEKGIECEIFHDWLCFQSFYQIFDIQHKNFCKSKIDTPNNSLEIKNIDLNNLQMPYVPIKITADNTAGLRRFEEFFKIYKLTNACFYIFEQKYNQFNCGNYAVIHTRGSCMIKNKHNGDYQSFLDRQNKRIEHAISCIPNDAKILFISDNQDLLVKYVDEQKIYSTSIALELYKQGIKISEKIALHSPNKDYAQGVVSEFDICFNAVLDLYLLAHAKYVYPDVEHSGFAQTGYSLYKLINQNKELRLLK